MDSFHHHDRASLTERAAKQGCPICQEIWDSFSSTEQEALRFFYKIPLLGINAPFSVSGPRLRRYLRSTKKGQYIIGDDWEFDEYVWAVDEDEDGIVMTFKFGNNDREACWKKISFGLVRANDTQAEDPSLFNSLIDSRRTNTVDTFAMMAAVDLADNLKAEQSWELILHWLDRSISVHDLRLPSVIACLPGTLPTRLVHVGSFDGTIEPHLSESTVGWGGAPYITLSHRWPSPEQEKTHGEIKRLSKTNLEAMKLECSVAALTPTFRDAIHVARELKIEYLWIDCLCIIQDDRLDKKKEIKKMGQIYKNAFCNIAAAEEYDPQHGLFRSHDGSTIKPFDLQLGSQFPVARRGINVSEPYRVFNTNFKKRNIYDAPVNKRAWVVQERCLSRRVLTFTRNQVFWESKLFSACEAFPHGYPKKLTLCEGNFNPIRSWTLDQSPNLTSDSPFELITQWHAIVALYSPCTLTDEKDRLNAIEGLAALFRERLPNDRYVAGLWESTMPSSLLWRLNQGRTADGPACKRIHERDLPTWSWVSVQGDVSIHWEPTTNNRDSSSRTVAAVLSTSMTVEMQAAMEKASKSTPLTLRAILRSLQYMDLWDFGESADTSMRRTQIKVRTAQFSGSVLALCVLDDYEDFTSRWAVGNTNYRLLLRRAGCPLAVYFTILLCVFATQDKLRTLIFAYVAVFGTLFCLVIPLIVPSTRFRLGLKCPYGGLFLLPIKEDRTRFNEGLVVSRVEDTSLYRREGYYYSSSKGVNRLSKLSEQGVTLI